MALPMGSVRLSPCSPICVGPPCSASSDVARPEQGGVESGDGRPFGSAHACAELRAAFAAEGAHALSAWSGSRSTSASAAVKQRLRRRLVTTLIRLGSHPWLIHWPIVCAAGARLKTAGVELRRARSCACVSSGRAGFIYFLCSVCAPAPRVDLVALVQTPDAFPDLITPSSADVPGHQVAEVVADKLAGREAVLGEASCPVHCRGRGAQALVTILTHDQTLLQHHPHVFRSGVVRTHGALLVTR